MTDAPTPAAYMTKAQRALAGARLLLAGQDADGACNRAYYAMFDAAHAALKTVAADPSETNPKTHHGLISAFGQRLVLTGKLDAQLGRALNQVQRLRQLADYSGEPVSLDDARGAVADAEAFLEAVEALTG